MSQAGLLIKVMLFLGLISFLIVVLAMDENFKEIEAYRTNWEDIQNQLGTNPLTQEPVTPTVINPLTPDTKRDRNCWIPGVCPVLPTTFILEGAIDVGQAIWKGLEVIVAIASEAFSIIGWGASLAWSFAKILGMAITFTVPGIPPIAKIALWGINSSIWITLVYIGFRAIRGGG